MSDLELVPPGMPGEKRHNEKKGFLKKFFFKHNNAQEAAESIATTKPQPVDSHNVDLDDIKKKLGLHEEEQPTPTEQQEPQPELSEEEFKPPSMRKEEPLPVKEAPVMEVENDNPDEVVQEEQPTPQTVEIENWSDEHTSQETTQEQQSNWDTEHTSETTSSESNWDTGSHTEMPPSVSDEEIAAVEEPPEHHSAVDEHLKGVTAEKTQAALAEEEETRNLPDWHVQEKEVHPGEYFLLHNGHPIRSLRELTEALEFINDTTLEHHMNEHRNDFAAWVAGVVKNPDLAEELSAANTRTELLDALKGHHKQSAKKLKGHVQTRQKTAKKLGKVNTDILKLRNDLEKKHEELLSLKKRTTKKVKEALDREVERKLGAERQEIQAALEELDASKGIYQKRVRELENKERKLDEKEEKIVAEEARLRVGKQEMKDLKAQHMQEKKEAAELLKDAQAVRKDLAAITRHKEATQKHLKDITYREGQLTKKEKSLKAREEKLTQDLSHLKTEEATYTELKGEHDKREAEVVKKELAAEKLLGEAKKRETTALDAERKTTAKIKEETKKLDAVRKKIETTLKATIKNKNKALYATELRKELETKILKAKEDVVAEREKLEKEGYKSFINNKTSTTPAGQKATKGRKKVSEKETGVYAKVEEARAALETGDFHKAKQLYNELRDGFQKVDLSAPERNAMYTNIRELYDDIHLAMLEQ